MNDPQARAFYSIVRRRIVDGDYAPGSPLPSWSFLADELGVGLATVREAFQQLEGEGLVSWDGGRATVAAEGRQGEDSAGNEDRIDAHALDEILPALPISGTYEQSRLDALIAGILQFLVESLSVGLAFLSRVEGETMIVEGVVDRAGMGLHQGDAVPLCDTYCTTMLTNAMSSLAVEDAQNDPSFGPRITTRTLGIGAYAGVPLYRSNGTLYGTLCTLHPSARSVERSELALLKLAGRVIMQAVEVHDASEARVQSLAQPRS